MRTCCIAQGTLLNAPWWPKWEGNPKQRGYMYSWFTLLYLLNISLKYHFRISWNLCKRFYGHNTDITFRPCFPTAAKSLQSCPTLCDPIEGSPSGSAVPGILQARTLEWVAISFSNAWKWKVKVKSLSRVRPSATPWTAACTRLLRPWDFPGKSASNFIFVYSLIFFPGDSDSKESTCNVGDVGSIPGWKDPLEEHMATHSSILAWRIPLDRAAWQATVHGVAKSRTQLSDLAQHSPFLTFSIICHPKTLKTFKIV